MGRATRVQIRRNLFLEDSFDALAHLGRDKLKGRIQVEFISEQGLAEAGIDGGGLFKSFLDDFIKHAFDPISGLFTLNEDQLFLPNPGSGIALENHLQYFNFVGKMLGICMYNRTLVEATLSNVFLNSLLGKKNALDDLFSYDRALHRSLMALKQLAHQPVPAGDPDPVERLGLFFEANTSKYDMDTTEELVPRGSTIQVNKSNVHSYIHRYANYKLNVEISAQTKAFLSGFRELIPAEWLRMFSSFELQLLISGEQKPIDIDEMRKHINYGGGYSGMHNKLISLVHFSYTCLCAHVFMCRHASFHSRLLASCGRDDT